LVPEPESASGFALHDDDVEDPILEAAHNEFSLVGIRRANMDAVALHAGVSRATLYRRFPTKSSLIEAVGMRAARWAAKRVARMVEGQTPKEALVTAIAEYARMLRTLPLLQEIVRHGVLRYNDGDGTLGGLFTQEKFVTDSIGYIAAILRSAGTTMPDEELRVIAEVQLRLAMSFVVSPSAVMDLNDDKAVRQFAKTYLSPMVY